ncbi:MAG: RNA methyltransferase, TrmH family [candidate division WS6 bacterium 36_33]|uniref:RNA methyltransferase, TrmH family n=1 Tax=candidate division WS6 bacterium 36_33 TaxID=1641388 RepID=A0A124FU32_9BACT|nr:MAG: RNA methyltransferase, TrmH family [candidate division WS6 bacterium 36_33]
MPKLKKYQKKFSHSYAFGIYPTLDLLKNRRESILKILLQEESVGSDGVKEIVEICKKEGIHYEVNDRLIEKLAIKENTYVVGIFKKYVLELEKEKNHIVLVEPRNMGNVGTIIRTMLGFGYKNLAIVEPAVDVFDPKVVRSTMGALFRINFEYFQRWEEYVEKYPNRNNYPFLLEGAKEIREIEFKEPISLIFGNEGEGLPDKFKDIGQSVYIQHSEDIDSLNLSIAASIGMWESVRRNEGETKN